jgi:hypothetical protein
MNASQLCSVDADMIRHLVMDQPACTIPVARHAYTPSDVFASGRRAAIGNVLPGAVGRATFGAGAAAAVLHLHR